MDPGNLRRSEEKTCSPGVGRAHKSQRLQFSLHARTATRGGAAWHLICAELLGTDNLDGFGLAHDRTEQNTNEKFRADSKADLLLHAAAAQHPTTEVHVGKVCVQAVCQQFLSQSRATACLSALTVVYLDLPWPQSAFSKPIIGGTTSNLSSGDALPAQQLSSRSARRRKRCRNPAGELGTCDAVRRKSSWP